MDNRVYSFDYSRAYLPPFPALTIELAIPERPTSISLTALVNTGSDAALIPLDIVQHMGARFIDNAQVRGMFGSSQPASLYLVRIRIGPHQIHAVQVAAVPAQREAILGRDVLGQLTITLNGPADTLELHE